MVVRSKGWMSRTRCCLAQNARQRRPVVPGRLLLSRTADDMYIRPERGWRWVRKHAWLRSERGSWVWGLRQPSCKKNFQSRV